MSKPKRRPRRPRADPRQNGARLVRMLQASFERATEPALKERLRRVIDALKERNDAGAP
jgi:hypothetical protein